MFARYLTFIVPFTLACAEYEDLESDSLSELSRELGEISADPVTAGLTLLTEDPVTSHANSEIAIQVWITPESEDEYLSVAPNASGSGAYLPEESLIIRDIYDEDMVLSYRTLIARMGHPDELGGWLFGVYDLNGEVMVNDDGSEMFGLMAECEGCHMIRADDDYLYGVPR